MIDLFKSFSEMDGLFQVILFFLWPYMLIAWSFGKVLNWFGSWLGPLVEWLNLLLEGWGIF